MSYTQGMLFSHTPARRSSLSRLMLAAGVLSLALLPGCGGCGGDDADADSTQAAADKDKDKEKTDKEKKDKEKKDKDKAKKEKPKPPPDFDPPRMAILPNDVSAKNITQSGVQGIKPGHWGSAILEMRANNFDFSGELDSWLMNSHGDSLGLQGLPYQLASRRPAILPKGQKKYFEAAFFVPPLEEARSPRLFTKLTTRGGGEVLSAPANPLIAMPAYQYYFVVLAREHEKYTILKHTPAINPPSEWGSNDVHNYQYMVTTPIVDKQVPLPSHLLAWTSIAYVLWDDANPDVLSEEQKTALIDWLHWGGQLLISGPDSLEVLQKPGGFLEPYLPATAGESIKIDQPALAELNRYWSLQGDTEGKRLNLTAVEPFVGVKLLPRPAAKELLHTGELFYERRVGRGRVVASAFRLSQREFVDRWRGFDGFFNGCLLARPSRTFEHQSFTWNCPTPAGQPALSEFNSTINTKLRLLSRDSSASELPTQAAAPPRTPVNPYTGDTTADFDNSPAQPGVGGWSDFNDVSNAARGSLIAAAGIEIPQASFVVWSLAAYLVVLVPVNWAFFRLIGKVEWAWIAAPILAIGGTVFVTKMAHLDIGFTRSEREVALVELHAGHPRAHVTRYTALYTSLSSSYQFAYDDPSAEVLPLSKKKDFQLLIGQGRSNVEYRQEGQVSLNGFDISSNSTGLIHSEQMADLGGAILVKGTLGVDGQIENGTKLNLTSAGVIRKRPDGEVELGWIGDLPAGSSQKLLETLPWKLGRFREVQETQADGQVATVQKYEFRSGPFFPDAAGTGDLAREEQWTKGRVLRELFGVLQAENLFKNGDVRLFAWTADEIPGAHTDPAASQIRRAVLVVAHLEYARLPAPRPDTNLPPLPPKQSSGEEDFNPQRKPMLDGINDLLKKTE